MNELIIIGGGSGNEEYLLPIAKTELENAEFVIASNRFLERYNVKHPIPISDVYKTIDEIPDMLKRGSVAVVVSGDPLMYSMLNTIQRRIPDVNVRVLPGIGSVQLLGCAFGLTMENAQIISIHGRQYSAGKIAYAVAHNDIVFFFCSYEHGPREIASSLIEYGIDDAEIYVGASLTYSDEELYHGKPSDIIKRENRKLCVAAVKNINAKRNTVPFLLSDDMFLRNESPMTKEEVRAVILSKLRLTPDSVVWDIGAGTGSISVECARVCSFGKVYAVEYKEKALDILKRNKEYFELDNLNIICGRAEHVIDTLPEPDCVFIGGSGGGLCGIIDKITALDKNIRIVVSAVTLETQAEAYLKMKDFPDFRVVKIDIGYDKPVGAYRVTESNHPVTLYCCKTKE